MTCADREAEALILTALADRWPGVQAVGEEQVEAGGKPGSLASLFWLIDPLDGTRGFVQGREAYTVNIALIRDGAPVAGVVSAPALGLTWATTRPGEGAVMRGYGEDWRPISVRARPERAVALVSHSMDDAAAERLATQHGCVGWQGMDSSLKFCLVAEGRFDAYPRTGFWELNDLYFVIFALPSIVLLILGTSGTTGDWATWIGAGIAGYGAIYLGFHDVIVHRRVESGYVPRWSYMKRIVQAHRLHHVVSTKHGTVSFGFIYAPKPEVLKAELKRRGLDGVRAAGAQDGSGRVVERV